MLDKLGKIDSSTVQELARIRREQALVQGYLDKAEELKDQVDALVFERVLEDYKCRQAALEQQARPLEEQAREQYRKLRSLQQELASTVEEVRLQKAELEFRRSLGELSEEQTRSRLEEAERLLQGCRSEMAEAVRLEKLFMGAFPSTEAFEKEKAKGESPDETIIVRSPVLPSGAPEKQTAGKRRSTPGESAPIKFDDTIIVPDAMLIAQKEGTSQEKYRLGALNYIGRNEENHIHIKGRGVSRQHAVVLAGPTGFQLKDLESRCGTFVNDKRIQEAHLKDGDRLRIGEVELVFRLA